RANRARAAAAVQQAQASLASIQVDLDRSIIRSPIDGVVVDRQVNPGQSVAASLQAPTLFIIAQDLSRLQANITVDEADIGEVREGQRVRFNVDAFPDEEFEGRVSQVRQQGVDTNGVVSYTVVVQADNPGRRLLPGMTANAEIVVEETQQVARIPNAALRFRPVDERLQEQARGMTGEADGSRRNQGGAIASERGQRQRGQGQGAQRGARQLEQLTAQLELTPAQQERAQIAIQAARQNAGQAQGGDRRAAMRRMRESVIAAIEPTLTAAQRARLAELQAGAGQNGPRETPTRTAVIFVLRDNRPTPVRVELGVADDSYTELRGGDLRDGDQIITGGGPRPDAAAQQQRGGSPFGSGGARPRIRGA
ncbi:MAG: efflux RND transporter periplasmic adaptor subunit, partial [Hyphomonadaceae bacterium]